MRRPKKAASARFELTSNLDPRLAKAFGQRTVAARKGVQHRLGPARRELEHHAVSRRAAAARRAIEIAGAVSNQAGLGPNPVVVAITPEINV